MATAWVYTLEDCEACERAIALAAAQGYAVRRMLIDNPLLELGARMLDAELQLRVPIVALPGGGLYRMKTRVPLGAKAMAGEDELVPIRLGGKDNVTEGF